MQINDPMLYKKRIMGLEEIKEIVLQDPHQ